MPDPRKSGGAYVTTEGKVDMIDEFERVIVLQDKTRIPVYDVYEIKSKFVARFMPDD